MKSDSEKNLFHAQEFSIHKAVLDQSAEGFSLLDSAGRYVGVNQAFCELTGYSESELLSMKIVDLVPSGTPLKLFPKLLEGHNGEQRIQILKKSGDLLQAHVKGSSITYKDQKYFMGIVSDISSQFEAEDNFKHSEEKYRLLFESAPDPIVIHNGKKILDLNLAALKALSFTNKKQLIGQDPFAFLHPDDRKLARQRLKQLLKDGKKAKPAEFRMVLKSQEVRTVVATPIPIEFDGQQAIMVNYHDITDRKATNEALLSSRQFTENLMETANTMVVAFDSEARVTTFNKFAEELTGYKKAEVIGKNWFDLFIPPRDRTAIPKLFSEVLQQMPESSQNENHIRLKGGGERLIRWSNNVMLSGSGEPQGVLSIGMDITERKEAEEALKLSEEHYRSVVQDQTEYIMRYLPDGSITFVNDSFCRAFNTNLEQAIGKNITHKNLDSEVERITRKIEALSLENPIITDEHISITPSGEKVWHLWVDRGIFDENGILKEIQAVGRDITSRKQMEESLHASSTQLQEAQRLAKMGPYSLDITTSMWLSSPVLSDIFGIDDNYICDIEGWLNLIHPEDLDKTRDYFQMCVHEKRSHFDTEYRIVRNSDKSECWVHGIGEFVFNTEGNPIKMIGMIQDITERKLADDEREKALMDARTANEVKDQFIANISHEIRTPLNSILGFSDILNMRYSESLQKRDENIFDYINSASKRLMRTVDSILNISQLEAGTIKVYPKTIDLVPLAILVIDELRPIAEEKGLRIHLSTAFKEAKVFADEYCIHQALINLTENAIKFTPEGSIDIDITQRQNQIALSVTDSGIGISEDYQERIFEPYTQESEGFTKIFQGVGLGMALTKRFADLNHVEIKLKSEGGVGTTFTLIFPPQEGTPHV
ncbi:MAG: PAS domain S-box protein [FCB group bacterium]|nr:PAS domain S-box protein [FCB group bacterium]MBL7026961.1 PAS domain S-box protein [Candidatus Neomarinimicrobiota bacterium]MBL7122141.1 PAS domain S-box protein [Candidatus Neomarinimicrobiota bacterium]